MDKYSSYSTIGSTAELSVKYNNLYVIDGRIVYVAKENINLPSANKFMNSYGWKPDVYIGDPPKVSNSIDLAIIGDCHWYGNIGHALWTGLYPIYTALCKFNLHNEVFDYFTTELNNHNTTSYPAIKKFIGGNIHDYSNIKIGATHINTLVAGTGSAGDNVMRPDYTMYGMEYDALRKFVSRMYRHHNIPTKNRSELKIIWIDNKRYTDSDRDIIKRITSERNIEYVEFSKVGGFYEHLQLYKDVDIQITAPGTAMIYLPFMKNGSINVNLGHMERPQKNTARPNIYIHNYAYDNYQFPAYMEQSLCNACYWTSTIYYDRYTYNHLEYEQLNSVIDKAINMWEKEIRLISHHNIDAQIFTDYCSKVDHAWDLCNYLTGKGFYIEFFVNEHPYAIPEYADLELLRDIKNTKKYNREYEYRS